MVVKNYTKDPLRGQSNPHVSKYSYILNRIAYGKPRLVCQDRGKEALALSKMNDCIIQKQVVPLMLDRSSRYNI